jgi:hypothetical protein
MRPGSLILVVITRVARVELKYREIVGIFAFDITVKVIRYREREGPVWNGVVQDLGVMSCDTVAAVSTSLGSIVIDRWDILRSKLSLSLEQR